MTTTKTVHNKLCQDFKFYIELFPHFKNLVRGGIRVYDHANRRKTPLWFGEATDANVDEAFRQKVFYNDLQEPPIEVLLPSFDFSCFAMRGKIVEDTFDAAYFFYFDSQRLLRGVAFSPVWDYAALFMKGYVIAPIGIKVLFGDSDEYEYSFNVHFQTIQSVFEGSLSGKSLERNKFDIAYPEAGTIISGQMQNYLWSLELFDQTYMNAVLTERGFHPDEATSLGEENPEASSFQSRGTVYCYGC